MRQRLALAEKRPVKTKWRERMAALKAGEMAPEVELPAVTGKQRHKFKLSDLRGKKNVILAFYPLDWSPT
jgi:peroxiredoxin